MADKNNPGQFGNREDTKRMAHEGGQAQGQENNPGNFTNRSEQDHKESSRKGGEASGGNS